MMEIPLEQLIIGIFALIGAIVTGIFSVYNTKISKKITTIEKRTTSTDKLLVGNEILEQIVPALERKDEALDKIAEILDNILRSQELTNQELRSMENVVRQRCMATDLLKALNQIKSMEERKANLANFEHDLKTQELQNKDDIIEELISRYVSEGKGVKKDS